MLPYSSAIFIYYISYLTYRYCRDEESPYLSAKGPAAGSLPTFGQRVWKELKQNWWLWGSVIFAILLVGGLVVFRNQLYDTASHGLPFLAGEFTPLKQRPLHVCNSS